MKDTKNIHVSDLHIMNYENINLYKLSLALHKSTAMLTQPGHCAQSSTLHKLLVLTVALEGPVLGDCGCYLRLRNLRDR